MFWKIRFWDLYHTDAYTLGFQGYAFFSSKLHQISLDFSSGILMKKGVVTLKSRKCGAAVSNCRRIPT